MDPITTAQAAEMLGRSPITIVKHIIRGRLKARKIGGLWLIDRKDLDAIRNLKPGPQPRHTKGHYDGD